MLLRCKCGYEENVNIHKDGYEVVAFICYTCRRKKKTFVKTDVQITLSNGDFFFVKKANKAGVAE